MISAYLRDSFSKMGAGPHGGSSGGRERIARRLRHDFIIAYRRTPAQEPEYGIHQLAQVAPGREEVRVVLFGHLQRCRDCTALLRVASDRKACEDLYLALELHFAVEPLQPAS